MDIGKGLLSTYLRFLLKNESNLKMNTIYSSMGLLSVCNDCDDELRKYFQTH